MRLFFLIAIFLCLLQSSCQSAFRIPQQSLKKKINVDDILLTSEQGEIKNFLDIAKAKAIVVIFWQTECPCVRRYQKRINDLYQRYKDRNIAFMHVSSNSNENFEDVLFEYHKRKIPLPIFRDENQVLAKMIGAKGTPTAAIINGSDEIIFLGWIDNERDDFESHRLAYLENALIEVVNNKPISVPTSPMFGCPIH